MAYAMMSIEQFAERFDIRVESTKIPRRTDGIAWAGATSHYDVTLYMGKDAIWHGQYSMGSAYKSSPTVYDVLCSLHCDVMGSDESFEDWAYEMGYEMKDIKKAKAAWETCNATRRTLQANMGSAWPVFVEQTLDGEEEPEEEELHQRFKVEVLPYIVKEYGPDDEPAISLGFCDWIDSLEKNGEITAWLAANIDHPELTDRDLVNAAYAETY